MRNNPASGVVSDFYRVWVRWRAESTEDREGSLHGKVTRGDIESLDVAWHHESVLNAREDMYLDVRHAHWHGTICVQHVLRCAVILVAPDDADRLGYAVKLTDVVEHLRPVAGYARVVAKPPQPENGKGTAIAEAHYCRVAIALRQRAQIGKRVLQIALICRYFLEARK